MDSFLPKLHMPIFKIPALSKNEKTQKTMSKDLPNKVTISKTYLDEIIKALVPSFFGLITEIHTNEELLKSVARSIRTFKKAMKKALSQLLLNPIQ